MHNACVCVCVTSFMQGNLLSLSSLEGGGTSRPLKGSRDRASRKRLSVSPFSLIAAPSSSNKASESEWERVVGTGPRVDARGERGALRGLSWGENTSLWPEPSSLMSMPSPCRPFNSLCS